MTRDEWMGLPPAIALAAIYDLLPELQQIEAPRPPMRPKYDGKLSKGEQGFVWFSEMLFEDLIFWHTRKSQSAAASTKWSERDGKTAETLAKWITWRRVYPLDQWFGVRGEDKVTAPPPRRNPKVYPWPANGSGQKTRRGSGSSAPQPDDSDDNLDDVKF